MKEFDAAIAGLIALSTANDPTKASSLLYAAIALADKFTLEHMGRLASLDEVQTLVRTTFEKLRLATGNAGGPRPEQN